MIYGASSWGLFPHPGALNAFDALFHFGKFFFGCSKMFASNLQSPEAQRPCTQVYVRFGKWRGSCDLGRYKPGHKSRFARIFQPQFENNTFLKHSLWNHPPTRRFRCFTSGWPGRKSIPSYELFFWSCLLDSR